MDLRVSLPPLGRGQLLDFIGPRLQICKRIRAACSGHAGIGGSAFDVLDLYFGSRQAGPGGTVDLFNPEVAVGFIFKVHLGGFSIFYGDLLDRLLIQQVILWGHSFIDGVIAHLSEGDGDGTGLRRGIDADSVPVRTHHLEGRPSQGHGGTGLVLGDFEGSLLRFRFWL